MALAARSTCVAHCGSLSDTEFLAAEDFVIELTDFCQRFDGTAKVQR